MKAAAFGFAFCLEHAGCLFLRTVSRTSIIGPTFDIEPGMRQRTKRGGEIIEALLQQDAGHGMNHLALQPDLNRRVPIFLAVLGIDRDDGMDKLMDEDAENFSGSDRSARMKISKWSSAEVDECQHSPTRLPFRPVDGKPIANRILSGRG